MDSRKLVPASGPVRERLNSDERTGQERVAVGNKEGSQVLATAVLPRHWRRVAGAIAVVESVAEYSEVLVVVVVDHSAVVLAPP